MGAKADHATQLCRVDAAGLVQVQAVEQELDVLGQTEACVNRLGAQGVPRGRGHDAEQYREVALWC